MPDISMCLNQTCPLRHDCYRSTATPNSFRQSYSDFKPRGSWCDNFIEARSKSQVSRLDEQTISWSQINDPTDFSPDASVGVSDGGDFGGGGASGDY